MVSEQKLIFYLLNGGQATVYVMGAEAVGIEIERLKVPCSEGRMSGKKDNIKEHDSERLKVPCSEGRMSSKKDNIKEDDSEWLKVSIPEGGRMYDEKDCPIYCGTSLGRGEVPVKATSNGNCAHFLLENVLSVDKITSSNTTTIYMKTTYVVQPEKRKCLSLPILDGPQPSYTFSNGQLIIMNKVGVPSNGSSASWLNRYKLEGPEESKYYAIPISVLTRVVITHKGQNDTVVYQAKK